MERAMQLAEFLCARMCHDITGPIGAISNGVEFLQDEGCGMQDQAVELIATSAVEAVARLQFFRVAYGSVNTQGETDLGKCRSLTKALFAHSKITLHWADESAESCDVNISAHKARLLLNLIVIAAATLIRGGKVSVSIYQDEQQVYLIVKAEGDTVRWDADSEALLARGSMGALDSRNVQLYYTHLQAQDLEINMQITSDAEHFACRALSARSDRSVGMSQEHGLPPLAEQAL